MSSVTPQAWWLERCKLRLLVSCVARQGRLRRERGHCFAEARRWTRCLVAPTNARRDLATCQRHGDVLSREHHVALEIALRLQRADEAQTETVRQATLHFWSSECIEHFRLEEELLLPALARHAGADDPDI